MNKYTVKVDNYGNQFWYQNGQLHRLDGPAISHSNGTKKWMQNGRFHRLDGPAIIWDDGTREWYINGVQLSERDFRTQTEIVEMTVAEVCKALGKNVKIIK